MAKKNIFVQSILHDYFFDEQFNNEIKKELENHESDNTRVIKSNVGGFQTPNVNNDYIKNKILLESKNLITKEYKLKSKLIFSLTGIWINKNKKNDFNTPHVHIKSNFSGIYFLETTKQNGTLQFYVNDAFSFAYNDNLFDTNEFNPSFFIEPKNNTLILFPSNLIHFVMPHYENNDRISLAFNIDIDHG